MALKESKTAYFCNQIQLALSLRAKIALYQPIFYHLKNTIMDNLIKTYLMVDTSTNYIKIGKSTNVFYREKTLQAEKPTIEGLFYVEDDIEKLLHSLFAEKRLRGEWFNLNQEDLDFIDQIVTLKGLIKKEFSSDNMIMISPTKNNYKPQIIKRQENNDNIAVQSIRFIEARYKESLTFWESFLVTKMSSMIAPEDMDFKPYKIYIKEVIDFMGLPVGGQVYTYIIDAAKRLLNRKIVIATVNEQGRKETIETHIVRCLQEPQEGENVCVTLTFLPELKPYLLQLHKDFTKLDMEIYKHLKTASSIRLYHILKSHLGKKQFNIQFDLEELKEILGVSEKYKLYAGFKMRVLDEARSRLSVSTDIGFTYEEVKSGKKVSAICFHLKNSPTTAIHDGQTLLTPNPNDEVQEKLILELTPIVVKKYGVSLKVFMNLAVSHTEGVIREAIKVTEKAIKVGKVENIAGFFVEAVRAHYADVKEQKKQVVIEQKRKIAEMNEGKEIIEKQKKDVKQVAYEREVHIFEQIIAAEPTFKQVLIDKIHSSTFGICYKSDLSFEGNLQNMSVKAAFLNISKDLKPKLFNI
jgi:plasmid replication initiation protein